MPWELMEQEIERLVSLKWFRRFHLLGGEPFLYKSLDKVLEKLCSVPEIEHVNIITNATVLPNAQILERLKDPKVIVRVSYYGELSKEYLDELIRLSLYRAAVFASGQCQRDGSFGYGREVELTDKDVEIMESNELLRMGS